MDRIYQFSQGSLQDYADCPRRYQLRYLLMQPWPGILPSSPHAAELHIQRGAAFHHLMHQHHVGIAASHISAATADDPVLHRWWQSYLLHPPHELSSYRLLPEVVLSAPLAGHRLVARLDLLAIAQSGHTLIVDWKTSATRTARNTLARRLQTRVYLYLVVRTRLRTKGQELTAEQAEMVYWFCEPGGATERFAYGVEKYGDDETYLAALIDEISKRRDALWLQTPEESRCTYCNYQSLCERQVGPALGAEDVEDYLLEPKMGLEQVAEVAF